MIKTHNKTKLKYLCKCTNRDPYKYKGSGVYWKRHLKDHGSDITTEVIFQTEDLNEFNSACLRYSKEFNVKDSDEWANLIEENGLDGGTTHTNPYWLKGFKHSNESKSKISESSKKKRVPLSENVKQKISDALRGKSIKCSPKGVAKTEEHKRKVSQALKGKPKNFSKNGLENMKTSVSERQKRKYKCSVCGKIGNAGQIGRYHKECMKELSWNKMEINQSEHQ
jgi:hypothetical protein